MIKYSLFITLFLVFICSVPAQSLFDKEITLDSHSGTVEEFLKSISEKGGFYFTYSSTQIPVDKRFFFLSRKQTVKAFLDVMFKDFGVEYVEHYNKIILKSVSSAVRVISITGVVKDKSCNDVVSNVNVKIADAAFGDITDINGNFSIQAPVSKFSDKITLKCSHIAYKDVTVTLKKDKIKNIEILMDMNVMSLPEVKIFGVPQIAYANTEFQIYDYELFYSKILLVVYEKKLSKSNILLVDRDMKVDCIKDINGTPVGMYKDCIGNVNLITFYYPFKITMNAGCLSVNYAKQDWQNKINKPCVAQAKNGLYYYYFYGPARLSVNYSYYNSYTKTDSVFRQIKDTVASNELKNKLENQDAANSRGSMADLKLSTWEGGDKESFQQDADDNNKKNQMYAPMLSIKDSLFIFNHCDGLIEVYSMNAKYKRRIKISYHKLSGWKHKIYTDRATNKVYTCFARNGIYEISEINLNTGYLEAPCKVPFSWIDKIQINEGNIYFLYKSAQYNYKKCLYKLKL